MRSSKWVLATVALLTGIAGCGTSAGDEVAEDGRGEGTTEIADDVGTTTEALRGGSQAFAWVNDPPTTFTDVHPDYSHSTASNSPIQAMRNITGIFTVRFPGLGTAAAGGNVQVVAYGNDSKRCKVASWERPVNSTDMHVEVHCHIASSGQRSNSAFVVRFAKAPANGGGPGAYLRIANPSAASPTVERSWNSTGALNSVSKLNPGLGRYEVLLRNLMQDGGSVQVTAFGTGSEHCKVLEWKRSVNDLRVKVNCFDRFGNGVDTPFSLNFIGSASTVGINSHGAFVWADRPDLTNYDPRIEYSKNTGATTASCAASNFAGKDVANNLFFIRHTDLPEIDGSPHVTAYGDGPNYCKLVNWDRADGLNHVNVLTRCFTGTGAVDTNTIYAETYATAVLGATCP